MWCCNQAGCHQTVVVFPSWLGNERLFCHSEKWWPCIWYVIIYSCFRSLHTYILSMFYTSCTCFPYTTHLETTGEVAALRTATEGTTDRFVWERERELTTIAIELNIYTVWKWTYMKGFSGQNPHHNYNSLVITMGTGATCDKCPPLAQGTCGKIGCMNFWALAKTLNRQCQVCWVFVRSEVGVWWPDPELLVCLFPSRLVGMLRELTTNSTGWNRIVILPAPPDECYGLTNHWALVCLHKASSGRLIHWETGSTQETVDD